MQLAVLARLAVGCEGVLKIVEIPADHRHVAEHGGHVQRLPNPAELFVRSPVLRERLVESILSIQDVAQIAVEPREAQHVPEVLEDGPRLSC